MIVLNFDCVDSTQNVAKKMLLNGYREFVVTADTQTAGVGRLNARSWVSCSGNFHASFVMKTLSTSTLIDDILDVIHSFIYENTGIIATKKYPNDILINHKKIAGVMAENVNGYTIFGVGLNITCAPIERATCLANYSYTCHTNDIVEYILSHIVKK